MIITSIIYWCIDKRAGQRMLYSLTGNIALNGAIKDYFKIERPIGKYGLKSMRVETATGYSFPSGHTQTATTFWTSIVILFKKKWLKILAVLMVTGAGLSRLYLAVHWPLDVILGFILGILFTIFLIKILDRAEISGKYTEMFLLLIPFAIMAIILKSNEYVKFFALIFGFTVGYFLEKEYISFDTINIKNLNKKEIIIKSSIRFIVGILSLALVYIVPKFILYNIYLKNNISMIIDFCRYSFVVIWGVAGAPYVFKKLNI
ncbi:phosphatase PAP2 family protein [Peptacetobacter sp.]|uniref:phosphatase PAP2 family protein n=1 Tax=Peptacetobacter sp. TaxID=2991975 RepID=UPI00260FD0C3|nr:phosphatase PAP2 family protein [Peptacetobacter sp.]